MKDKKHNQIGFTLIEMLVVIAIIALLAAIMVPAVANGIRRGQATRCLSHLRSFGIVWNQRYLEDASNIHAENNPSVFDWLSDMTPDLVPPEMLICPADRSRGAHGGKPIESPNYVSRLASIGVTDTNNFPEADDPRGSSYLYEFNANPCTWANGFVYRDSNGTLLGSEAVTWGEVKQLQLRYGDRFSMNTPYSPTSFALARCFHHYEDRIIHVMDPDQGRVPSTQVINVAVAGNVFISGLTIEFQVVP